MIHKRLIFIQFLLAAFFSSSVFAQDSGQIGTLSIDGVPGAANTVTIKNKLYVDVDVIVQLLGATQNRSGNRVTLYLRPTSPASNNDNSPLKLSRPFIVTGIELMSTIREWRRGIISATVNSYPFLEQFAGTHQRDSDSKLALASAAAVTDADRNALELLRNESGLMRQFSDRYVEKRKNSIGVFSDEIDNDQLSQQILDCAKGMSAMAASHEFQDVPSCH